MCMTMTNQGHSVTDSCPGRPQESEDEGAHRHRTRRTDHQSVRSLPRNLYPHLPPLSPP